jgi:hypothetical protein
MPDSSSPWTPEDAPVQREFVLTPLFRRVRARLARPVFASGIDPNQLPPDTFIVYPDRMGNYDPPQGLGQWAPLLPEVANAKLEAVENEPEVEVPLSIANLSFFTHHALVDDEVHLTEAAPDCFIQSTPPPRVAEQLAAPKPARIRTMSAAVLANVRGRWPAMRPAVTYGTVGFVTCLMLFSVPALRRPASSLLPSAMRAEAVVSPTAPLPVPAQQSAAPAPVASVPDVLASPQPTERPSALMNGVRDRRPHRRQDPDVIVHHYGNQPTQTARVVRTKSGVIRYSDLD